MSHGSISSAVEPSHFSFVHSGETPRRRAPLSSPLIVTVGAEVIEFSRPEQCEVIHLPNKLTAAHIAGLAKASEHQTVLFALDMQQTDDETVEILFTAFAGHLLYRIVLLRTPETDSTASLRCLAIPMTNPCQPLKVISLPKEQQKLEWEIQQFFKETELISRYCKSLLKINSLTDREHRVANYLAHGLQGKKIAGLLSVSEKTIEKYRGDIYKKLGVASGPELASLVTFKNFYRWPLNTPYPE